MGDKNKKKSQKNIRYDIEKLYMSFLKMRKKLWLRCFIKFAYEIKT